MTAKGKRRIDLLLVERGLAESRQKAQALLLAGEVLVDGLRIDKPGRVVAADARLEITGKLPYVSRGGLKLEAALRAFGVDVGGKVCIDVGASTGGFTDCLLQHGAARVYAVDTGSGQIAWKLRQDPRVILREQINARYLTLEDLGERVDVLVCDVSFISVTLLLPRFPALIHPHGVMIILIKPQFEVGKGLVGKGGVVRDVALQQAACQKVSRQAEALGYQTELIPSPILGSEGNQEFFLYVHH
ncbi:MAG: TlyA family RNA methyltransferase [Bryobacteraceae bacterium]|nr:TlyA family RNA methyltransferase [Bryobacteraceae bacterium]MDW8380099.1 TlyA family RNA methyltransferase [Bryobacterales bacterium]